jgi:peptidoglycan-N-acetylglucosamine deacetylase
MSFIYRRVAPFLFPSVLWYANDATIHLTFDDGPHPIATPEVLDILNSRQLKATFFLLGENVERYPDLARAISEEGHLIGNHALVHKPMIAKSRSFQSQQMSETNRIIEVVTGNTPSLFRPPFGMFTYATLRAATSQGLRTVLWDVDSKDYASSDMHAVTGRVTQQTLPGSIILFHDNESTSKLLPQYLNPILDDLQHRDMKFSTLGL